MTKSVYTGISISLDNRRSVVRNEMATIDKATGAINNLFSMPCITDAREDSTLSMAERQGIMLLAQKKYQRSSDNQERVDWFLGHAWGNRRINQLVKEDDSLPQDVIKHLSALTYKTQHIKKWENLADKLSINFQRYINQRPIPQEERVSLSELRNVEKLAGLTKNLEFFLKEIKEADKRELYEKALKVSQRAQELLNGIQKQLEVESKGKSGDLNVYDMLNDYAYWGRSYDRPTRCVASFYRTNIMHVSIGIQAVNGGKIQQMESHMWGSPQSLHNLHRRPIGSHVFKQYRIDVAKLVNEKYFSVLEKRLGALWREDVQLLFHEVCREFHFDKKRFTHLHNPSINRLPAIIGPKNGLSLQSLIEKAQFRESGHTVCSEFVIKSTVQCLYILKDVLCTQLNLNAAKDLLKMPVNSMRCLERMLPHDVFRELKPVCTEIKQPDLLHHIFEFNKEKSR